MRSARVRDTVVLLILETRHHTHVWFDRGCCKEKRDSFPAGLQIHDGAYRAIDVDIH